MGTIVDTTHGSGHPRRHPAWISRYRARARSERGATLIEAAVVTPIFVMFLLAIAEGGLYMRNNLGVANTVRAGARAASAAGSDDTADLYTIFNVARESQAIPREAIEYVVVYKASGFGAGPTEQEEDGVPAGCLNGYSVANLCNVYRPADFVLAEAEMRERSRAAAANEQPNPARVYFTCKPTSPDRYWCPTDRVDSYSGNGGQGPDYVGVYMKIDHDWLTGLFGDSFPISDQSVIKIEPRRK